MGPLAGPGTPSVQRATPLPAVAAALPAVPGALARMDRHALASTIVLDHLPEIPSYARMSELFLVDQIVAVVEHNLDLFVDCVAGGREPTDAELDVLRQSAAARSQEGMPLQDVLRGYRLGARVAWDHLQQAAGAEDGPALLVLADRMLVYVDAVSTAVAQAYVEEREQVVSEQERWARALLDALVAEAPAEQVRRLAERAGGPAAPPYRAFAIATTTGAAREHASLAIGLRSRGIVAITEGERVVGVTGEMPSTLPLPSGTVHAHADGQPGDAFGAALERCRAVVDVARRLGRTGEVDDADLLPELLLAQAPDVADRMVARVLGPLEEYARKRGSDLLATLTAYVEEGCDRRRSADRLVVHPNTLDYRLQRIEQLTRLRLDDPRDRMLVLLALRRQVLRDVATDAL